MSVPRLCSAGCDTGGGGACSLCGSVACTTSTRIVAVKLRLPCVLCSALLSAPAGVYEPAAVPLAEPAMRPSGRLRVGEKQRQRREAPLRQVDEVLALRVGEIARRLDADRNLGKDVACECLREVRPGRIR